MEKFTENQWQELADKVALFEKLKKEIEETKAQLREVEDETELTNQFVYVDRTAYTTTTYPEEYTNELNKFKKKLEEKYNDKIVKVTKPHYKVKLIPMKKAETKAETITNNVVTISNAKLKKFIAASAQTKAKANGKNKTSAKK